MQGATANATAARQTAANGPLTTAGLPSFLPASSVNLNLTSQNITALAPLIVTAANGWSTTAGAPSNRIGLTTTNLTWAGLTDATTNYLYVTVAAAGTLTTGFTTVQPIYQWGGTPAVTANLFTFNIAAMQGFFGNGVAAPQAYIVFVGEAVAAAGAITSTRAYAFNGQYQSALTATLPGGGSPVTANHNIGTYPQVVDCVIQNLTPEANYVAGDQVHINGLNTVNATPVPLNLGLSTNQTTLTLVVTTGGNPWSVLDKSTGGNTALTLANWEYGFIVRRGW